MKRKIVWLVISVLMVLSLLVAACAPKVEEKAPAAPVPAAPVAPTAPAVKEAAPVAPAAPAKEMVKLTLTKLDGAKMEKLVEKPRYGGTLRWFTPGTIRSFDMLLAATSAVSHGRLTWDTLGSADWTKSSAGTGETNFWSTLYYPPVFIVPKLVERWETPDANTVIYHLRKGVKFQDKSPKGTWSGREMTSDDVVFSLKKAYVSAVTTAGSELGPDWWPVSVEATDKYTVVVKTAPGKHILALHYSLVMAAPIVPRDAYEKFGNMNDWRNAVGTGPFFFVDWVPASAAIFERNPDYFGKDPLFPENQLPYVDKVEWFIIPDKSTQTAALRTGKIDKGELDTYDDLEAFLKTRPDLQWTPGFKNINSYNLQLTMDNPKLPHADVRVRRALSMAIDRDTIIKNYFRGYADKFHYPVPYIAEYVALGLYVPLEQQPPSVQEIFSYNPAKAKQLLAEAGYPKGFKTSVDVSGPGGPIESVDYMSVIKEYFAAIGVDMEIRVRDFVVAQTMALARNFEHMNYGIAASAAANPYVFADTRWPPGRMNRNKVNDPYINEMFAEIGNLVYDEPAQRKLYKEKAYAYILEQVYSITVPMSHLFPVRQPWLRNNDGGESSIGGYQFNSWPIYAWIDQELKKSLGY